MLRTDPLNSFTAHKLICEWVFEGPFLESLTWFLAGVASIHVRGSSLHIVPTFLAFLCAMYAYFLFVHLYSVISRVRYTVHQQKKIQQQKNKKQKYKKHLRIVDKVKVKVKRIRLGQWCSPVPPQFPFKCPRKIWYTFSRGLRETEGGGAIRNIEVPLPRLAYMEIQLIAIILFGSYIAAHLFLLDLLSMSNFLEYLSLFFSYISARVWCAGRRDDR